MLYYPKDHYSSKDIINNSIIPAHDIVWQFFRTNYYMHMLNDNLTIAKKQAERDGIEKYIDDCRKRIDRLRPYVMPALDFVADPIIRARCVRMVIDLDPSERSDTWEHLRQVNKASHNFNSTNPYDMLWDDTGHAHSYNADLIPVLTALPSNLYVMLDA